jgi:N-acetylmuramoyl-L-alanine amidase
VQDTVKRSFEATSLMANQNLEDIHTIVVHCSATREGVWVDAHDIDVMHRERKPPFSMIGYHRVIRLDGSVEQGRPYTRRGAHVLGNNINTLGICLIGGLDDEGTPKDTFTDQQFHSLNSEIINIKTFTNVTNVCGHRDFSPDLNGDGLITPNEFMKECPCFDVGEKLKEWRI